MSTPRVLSALALGLIVALPAVAGRHQVTYDPDSLQSAEDLEASASEFWKASGLKKIAKEEMQRLAIVEFNIEYLTAHVYDSNNQQGGLLGTGLKLGGVGKRHWELDEQFKLDLPERPYGELVGMLEGRGVELVPLEELRESEAFQRLKAEDEGSVGKKKSSTGGRGYSAKKSQKYEVHSVDGLLDLKDGKGQVIDIDEVEFEKALNEMYPAFMGMAIAILK